MSGTARFLEARDFLLAHREDYDFAWRHFHWPQLDEFNWALDYFDRVAAGNSRPALEIVAADGSETTLRYSDLFLRSNQVACYLRRMGSGVGTVFSSCSATRSRCGRPCWLPSNSAP